MYRDAGKWIEQQLGPLHLPAASENPISKIKHDVDQQIRDRMRSLAEDCLAERDVHAAVDAKFRSGMLSSEETFSSCIALSAGFKKINDNLTAVHFLNVALTYVDENDRSEEHTSELQSLMRISYAVF